MEAEIAKFSLLCTTVGAKQRWERTQSGCVLCLPASGVNMCIFPDVFNEKIKKKYVLSFL